MKVKLDCRYYKGNMPCIFHKKDKMLCDTCTKYDPIKMRILIIKLGSIGDVLRTTPILPAFKKKYEGCEITWITKSNAASLFKGNEYVDRLLLIEENYLEFILNEKFDIGICLDSDQISATIHRLASCTNRYGFIADDYGHIQPANDLAKEWWHMGLNDDMKKKNRKTYQQIMFEICQLPHPIPRPLLFLSSEALKHAEAFAKLKKLEKYPKVIGVNTGGGSRWQYKKWTQEGYVDLITRLRELGVGIILFGGPEEVKFNAQILKKVSSGVIDAGCGNTLLEFASLINLVDVFFTPDSLGMHIAVALKKPVIVLVGPTSPWELDLYGTGEVICSDVDCIACYLEHCDKVTNCMNTLKAEFVFEKVKEYL